MSLARSSLPRFRSPDPIPMAAAGDGEPMEVEIEVATILCDLERTI
jgi:hypothetical protein